MPVVLKNNAFGFLHSAISNSDTTAVLTTGTGANFPTLSSGEYFYATISPIAGASEIVKVTARSGDLLTIVRAQEGTSALSFPAGSRIELRVTARSVLDAIDDKVATKDQASEIAFTPVGGISSTNVQAALAEVDSEKVAFTQLAANSGAALVGYLPAGTGAVTRTVQDKMREWVSVKDFGAVGDGVTDDTAAINAASLAAIGKALYFPSGVYLVSDAINIQSNTLYFGDGAGSVIKSVTLASGGVVNGQRQFSAQGKTGFSILNLKFDCSGITTFLAGVRAISLIDSSNYTISNCWFKTPGAAVASIGCSYYEVSNNYIEISSTDSVAYHDGVIDQWEGSHHFNITGNIIEGAGIGIYGILMTGTTTSNIAAPCHDFHVSNNSINSVKHVGIWCNGRSGVNYNFTISNNIVDTVSHYYGIAVSDARNFSVTGNVTKNTAYNGIALYKEAGHGITSCHNGTVNSNVVIDANVLLSGSLGIGAAIRVDDQSSGITISSNRVSGTTHTYAIFLGAGTTNNEVIGYNYSTGTMGVVYNPAGATNTTPGGSIYTPTLTAVTNVASYITHPCQFRRDGNVVTVRGKFFVTPATSGILTELRISLPIASDFTNEQFDVIGLGNSTYGLVYVITADTSNNAAILRFRSTNTVANDVYFIFQYIIK